MVPVGVAANLLHRYADGRRCRGMVNSEVQDSG